MSASNKIIQAAAGNVETAVEPVGIDFDGTNDYLSRSSDLTGNSDSKTFTFSAWVWSDTTSSKCIYSNRNPSNGFQVFLGNGSQITVFATNSSGTTILSTGNPSGSQIAKNTWSHVLISIDLTNASNRFVYINDENRTSDYSWATYTNDNIDFTQTDHRVADRPTGSAVIDGRLAGVYLDYTYRDLVSDSKQATVTFSVKVNSTAGDKFIYDWGDGPAWRLSIDSGGSLEIKGERDDSTEILNVFYIAGIAVGQWYHVSLSVDMSNTDKRHLLIDGVEVSPNWNTYINDLIDFDNSEKKAIAATRTGSSPAAVDLSEFYFDTTYIDLSSDNPFYDTETGKPKYLGASGELPTGSSPLVYLPLRADDAGNNLGTGGDFTVNSGPYTGARGPSEFWGESAEFDGTDQYLSRTSVLSGISDSSVISLAVSVFIDNTGISPTFLNFQNSGGSGYLEVRQVNNQIRFESRDLTNTDIFELNSGAVFTSGTWHTILFCIDTSDAGATNLYIDGGNESLTTAAFTSGNIPLSSLDDISIAKFFSTYFDGKIGFLWFNTEYIDFSQEANRLKFFDAFNNPVDLGEDGSTPTGNQPLIYLNEGFHLGTNLGSGGNFTPQNTPTDGGYVKG